VEPCGDRAQAASSAAMATKVAMVGNEGMGLAIARRDLAVTSAALRMPGPRFDALP